MGLFCFFAPVVVALLTPAAAQTCGGDTVGRLVTGGPGCIYLLDSHRLSDGTCPTLVDAARHVVEEFDEEHLIAYYPLDNNANDRSSHGRHGTETGSADYRTSDAKCRGSRFFDGASKIEVDAFRSFQWGEEFSISVWFKRTDQFNNYQGIVNNGYGSGGSWEVRMGRENSGTMIGGGIITDDSSSIWDYINLSASANEWHHVVMSYGCGSLKYYLDNVPQEGDDECCTGPILVKDTPLTIGQAGPNTAVEYFYGYIDEVKLFNKALTAEEVGHLFEHPC